MKKRLKTLIVCFCVVSEQIYFNTEIISKQLLWHGAEYSMGNIFRISHIF